MRPSIPSPVPSSIPTPIMATLGRLLAVASLAGLGGCIALKADQDEIAKEVDKLRKEVVAQSEAAERNQELADQVDAKLAEVEELLRNNQANLGLRVENLELPRLAHGFGVFPRRPTDDESVACSTLAFLRETL